MHILGIHVLYLMKNSLKWVYYVPTILTKDLTPNKRQAMTRPYVDTVPYAHMGMRLFQ